MDKRCRFFLIWQTFAVLSIAGLISGCASSYQLMTYECCPSAANPAGEVAANVKIHLTDDGHEPYWIQINFADDRVTGSDFAIFMGSDKQCLKISEAVTPEAIMSFLEASGCSYRTQFDYQQNWNDKKLIPRQTIVCQDLVTFVFWQRRIAHVYLDPDNISSAMSLGRNPQKMLTLPLSEENIRQIFGDHYTVETRYSR